MFTFKVEIFTLNLKIPTLDVRGTLCIRTRKEKIISREVHKRKRGVLNVIKELKHFILCNMIRHWSILLFSTT